MTSVRIAREDERAQRATHDTRANGAVDPTRGMNPT
jgi:hypothetical protein